MGMFSWCTSDTHKSIAVYDRIDESENYFAREVYVLVPKEFQKEYGEFIFENKYDGYGEFGGHDIYALIAKWNAPELCKDENGEWLPVDDIREIGIALSCYDVDHVQLRYPIKIVEDPVSYENANISPNCPFQGFIYPTCYEEIENGYFDDDDYEVYEVDTFDEDGYHREIESAFEWLKDAKKAYIIFQKGIHNLNDYHNLKIECEEISEKTVQLFNSIVVKSHQIPEDVLMYLAETGDVSVLQDEVENPILSADVLKTIEKRGEEMEYEYLINRVRNHPQYKRISLEEKMMKAKEMGENQTNNKTHEEKDEDEKDR